MVVDTSAIVAIARNEPERGLFIDKLADAPGAVIASATWMESQMVVFSRSGDRGLIVLRDVMESADIQVAPVTMELAELAVGAFRRFGKGRHAAGLNFGDCFSYALAKDRGEPLLFKGNDFSKTDVVAAVATR